MAGVSFHFPYAVVFEATEERESFDFGPEERLPQPDNMQCTVTSTASKTQFESLQDTDLQISTLLSKKEENQ